MIDMATSKMTDRNMTELSVLALHVFGPSAVDLFRNLLFVIFIFTAPT